MTVNMISHSMGTETKTGSILHTACLIQFTLLFIWMYEYLKMTFILVINIEKTNQIANNFGFYSLLWLLSPYIVIQPSYCSMILVLYWRDDDDDDAFRFNEFNGFNTHVVGIHYWGRVLSCPRCTSLSAKNNVSRY